MENKTQDVFYAKVETVLGKTGSRGGVTQVQVQLLTEKRKMIRNVKGPVKKGDIIALLECEREARRMK